VISERFAPGTVKVKPEIGGLINGKAGAMVIIMGTVRLDPKRLDAARPAMAAMVEGSRAEAGCLHYAYAEDVLDRGLVRVSEFWSDHDALALHRTAPHMAAWRAAWPDLGLRDRDLQIIEAGEPRPY